MVRRAAWTSGFDESMGVAEDVDLVWRTAADGWRVRYEPQAVVRHDHRTDVRNWLARKAFYGTGAALLAERHGDAVAPMVVSPWTVALAGSPSRAALMVRPRRAWRCMPGPPPASRGGSGAAGAPWSPLPR